jgi:hypothetical protein
MLRLLIERLQAFEARTKADRAKRKAASTVSPTSSTPSSLKSTATDSTLPSFAATASVATASVATAPTAIGSPATRSISPGFSAATQVEPGWHVPVRYVRLLRSLPEFDPTSLRVKALFRRANATVAWLSAEEARRQAQAGTLSGSPSCGPAGFSAASGRSKSASSRSSPRSVHGSTHSSSGSAPVALQLGLAALSLPSVGATEGSAATVHTLSRSQTHVDALAAFSLSASVGTPSSSYRPRSLSYTARTASSPGSALHTADPETMLKKLALALEDLQEALHLTDHQPSLQKEAHGLQMLRSDAMALQRSLSAALRLERSQAQVQRTSFDGRISTAVTGLAGMAGMSPPFPAGSDAHAPKLDDSATGTIPTSTSGVSIPRLNSVASAAALATPLTAAAEFATPHFSCRSWRSEVGEISAEPKHQWPRPGRCDCSNGLHASDDSDSEDEDDGYDSPVICV